MPQPHDDDKLQRITFELDPGDWHRSATERLWAEPVTSGDIGHVYRLVNSPFFARGVSYLDIVRATLKDGEQGLYFDRVLERSGHSTYMLLVHENSTKFEAYWNRLEALGCTYESMTLHLGIGTRKLYAVDVPDSADIYAVYAVLERGESEGVWTFQEGCVGHALKR